MKLPPDYQNDPQEYTFGAIDDLNQRLPFSFWHIEIVQSVSQLPVDHFCNIVSCMQLQHQIIALLLAGVEGQIEVVPGPTRGANLGMLALSQPDHCIGYHVVPSIFVEAVDKEAKAGLLAFELEIAGHQLIEALLEIFIGPRRRTGVSAIQLVPSPLAAHRLDEGRTARQDLIQD